MTQGMLVLLLAIAVIAALVISADRRRTIVVCAFERGKVRVVRGKLATRVLVEIRDVAERNRLDGGRLVLRRENGAPKLDLHGIDDARAAQQLRNVIGRFRLPELR